MLRKKNWGCTARLFAQDFDAVLVVVVILAGEAIFSKFDRTCIKHIKLHYSDEFQDRHVPKFQERLCLPEKTRLRQAYRPHQAYLGTSIF